MLDIEGIFWRPSHPSQTHVLLKNISMVPNICLVVVAAVHFREHQKLSTGGKVYKLQRSDGLIDMVAQRIPSPQERAHKIICRTVNFGSGVRDFYPFCSAEGTALLEVYPCRHCCMPLLPS